MEIGRKKLINTVEIIEYVLRSMISNLKHQLIQFQLKFVCVLVIRNTVDTLYIVSRIKGGNWSMVKNQKLIFTVFSDVFYFI